MSLDKGIEHGKEHRKQYYRAKAVSKNCRNHGTCDWCLENRQYRSNRINEGMNQLMKDYRDGKYEQINIYVIMVCEKLEEHNNLPDVGASRVVGFYTDRSDAEFAVKNNSCDIWEMCYDYAIIEEVEEGLYSLSTERSYYKYDTEDGHYHPIPEPDFMKHLSGFTIG